MAKHGPLRAIVRVEARLHKRDIYEWTLYYEHLECGHERRCKDNERFGGQDVGEVGQLRRCGKCVKEKSNAE